MDNREKMDQITTEVVRKAVMGADIRNNPVMLVETYNNEVPAECLSAIEVLRNNHAGLMEWLQNRLLAYPLINEFFGRLIEVRLTQRGILRCPIFRALCDDERNLELRLERTRLVAGVEEIKNEYHASSQPDETDKNILNLWAEILILDFMLQLGFSDIRRVLKQKAAHLDIMGLYGGKQCAIEVTRKQEVADWQTVPYGNLEDCGSLENHLKICQSLLRTLKNKNDQLARALSAATVSPSAVKVLAIKTSDFGFSQCADEVAKFARMLLIELKSWNNFDCIWFVPNSEASESRWICKDESDLLKNVRG